MVLYFLRRKGPTKTKVPRACESHIVVLTVIRGSVSLNLSKALWLTVKVFCTCLGLTPHGELITNFLWLGPSMLANLVLFQL